ncbi:hypothetical protein [Flavobacterium sp. 3HN19-14]|uniref:hypothetical protein n=1 Tax=Flavobacterium sp. 3HN19-14 TaxID=3448133 RepID=UPI003EE08337
MKSSQQYADISYKKFSAAKGNQHIATLFALKKIVDLIQSERPKNVLEIGLGIGSICDTILEFANNTNTNLNYYGTENNDFCLHQLPLNLKENYKRLKLYPTLADVPRNIKYDLVIIDGTDDSLENIKEIITKNGVIFIEGDRAWQSEKMRELFPENLYVHCISNYKNPDYGRFSSEHWSGGGKLIYVSPTIKQKLNYIRERLRSSYRDRILRTY